MPHVGTEELDAAYAAKDAFLKEVREAYRKHVLSLPEESVDTARYMCQDELSLFSPWMNADDQSS